MAGRAGGAEGEEELFGVGPLGGGRAIGGGNAPIDVELQRDEGGAGRGQVIPIDVDGLLNAHDQHARARAAISQERSTLPFHAPSPRTLPQPEDDDSTVPAELPPHPPPTAEQAALDAALGREELTHPPPGDLSRAEGSAPDAKRLRVGDRLPEFGGAASGALAVYHDLTRQDEEMRPRRAHTQTPFQPSAAPANKPFGRDDPPPPWVQALQHSMQGMLGKQDELHHTVGKLRQDLGTLGTEIQQHAHRLDVMQNTLQQHNSLHEVSMARLDTLEAQFKSMLHKPSFGILRHKSRNLRTWNNEFGKFSTTSDKEARLGVLAPRALRGRHRRMKWTCKLWWAVGDKHLSTLQKKKSSHFFGFLISKTV